MDPLIAASLISAGSNFLGSRMDERSMQGMTADDRRFQYKMWQRNRDEQRIFAQQGLRWRVDDAKAAGLHPLAALGLSGASSFSPVMGGGSGGSVSSRGDAIRATGAAVAQMVADREESKSRTALNNAQADLLKQQAHDSAVARVNQVPAKDIFQPKFVQQQMTPGLHIAGVPVRTSRFSADAQTMEDRYGEVVGAIAGALNVPFDIGSTIYEAVAPQLQDLLYNINN